MWSLEDFVRESNRIEGISRDPTVAECSAHERFLALDKITVRDLEAFVGVVQPGKALRRQIGQNVRVGNHIARPGSPEVEAQLEIILGHMDERGAYKTHLAYEDLHPRANIDDLEAESVRYWQVPGGDVSLEERRLAIRGLSARLGLDLSGLSERNWVFNPTIELLGELRDAITLDPYEDDNREPDIERARQIQDATNRLRRELEEDYRAATPS